MEMMVFSPISLKKRLLMMIWKASRRMKLERKVKLIAGYAMTSTKTMTVANH